MSYKRDGTTKKLVIYNVYLAPNARANEIVLLEDIVNELRNALTKFYQNGYIILEDLNVYYDNWLLLLGRTNRRERMVKELT